MIYPIIAYGDPVLRQKARELKKDELDVAKLSQDMFETMYAAHGVGLACPQIGLSLRMFVVDGKPMDEELEGFKKVFINPQLLDESGEPWLFEEGCLSIPGIRDDVTRNPIIRIQYYDENWQKHEEEFGDLKARIIQHEYDHIEGILFTDYLSGFKKRILKGKLTGITRGKVEVDYRMKFPLKS
ncbi:MAG: peptide deformylase [Cyclobacteriaceae bacterium]|nr:peptide deformylase [Cyclobacteriaceae bacterium]